MIHQITDTPCTNHHAYFLNQSFTPDGCVVFTSYRDAGPQLYERKFPDGPIRRLTHGPGIHAYSAALLGDEVCFTRGGTIFAVERRTGRQRLIADFPGTQLGECSLSPGSRWVTAAMKDAQGAGIVVAATDGSGGGIVTRFPRTVIHPQFDPVHPEWIEFAGDPAPRMHRVRRDGSGLECLYEHGNDEFVVHETFLGRTGDLAFVVWPFALKRLHNSVISTIAQFNAWHITPNAAGTRIVCDTNHPDIGIQLVDVATGERRTVCFPRASNGGSQWKKSRYALAEDWQALSWMEVPADTVYGPQSTHPHPSFSRDERMVIYDSDTSGFTQVYVVEL